MKRVLSGFVAIIIFSAFGNNYRGSLIKKQNVDLPKYDHIVIVIEENKNYSQVIGNKNAPYINNILVKEGANLTRMFAEEHFSEGNYFWLFAGSNLNVGYHDVIPDSENNPKYPFNAPNLGEELVKNGYTFKGYSESLPEIGDKILKNGLYARKHVPWISFSNIPQGKTVKTSTNLRFKQFPTDFNKLPTVSIVIPNLIGDMHSGKPSLRVKNGDEWLRKNLNNYYQWAKKHNSLLIITWDENSDKIKYSGLTDPASKQRDVRNRIPTIFAGAHVKHGNFAEGKGITHVNILRTIEAVFHLSNAGHQQKNALKYGISGNYIIKDIFSAE